MSSNNMNKKSLEELMKAIIGAKIEYKIIFDENGTYEIYAGFKNFPSTNVVLTVRTKDYSYYITESNGELSSKVGVEYLKDRLRKMFLNKIAEYSDSDSLAYRSGAYNKSFGKTIYDVKNVLKKQIRENGILPISYKELEILMERKNNTNNQENQLDELDEKLELSDEELEKYTASIYKEYGQEYERYARTY